MLTLEEKISTLENCLNKIEENYADSFRFEILMFISDFNIGNKFLNFLNELNSSDEIESWVSKLTSRIVLKFDSESENIRDFIYDYIKFGWTDYFKLDTLGFDSVIITKDKIGDYKIDIMKTNTYTEFSNEAE